MSTRAAQRYAKAVLESAADAGTQEVVYGDMKSITGTLEGSKELRNVLSSPIIKAEDKRESLKAIFKGNSDITLSLIDILVDKNRTQLLDQVAQSYINLYNKSQGLVVAQVTTAVELNKELESKILNKVKQITGSDEARLDHKIDPAILGGFVLRVGDVQYDASVANQLDEVKKEFSKRL